MPAPHASPRTLPALLLLAVVAMLAGCTSLGDRGPMRSAPSHDDTRPPRVVDHGPWPNPATRQLVVVLTPNWDAPQGRLARFDPVDGNVRFEGPRISVGDTPGLGIRAIAGLEFLDP